MSTRKILVEMTEAEFLKFIGAKAGKGGSTDTTEDGGDDNDIDSLLGGDSTEEETITVEMIQSKVKELGTKGKKEAIVKLLAKYKYKTITAIPEAKFAAFMADLEKIK